jgi:O-succinylbenzoic acid--CoA ligase
MEKSTKELIPADGVQIPKLMEQLARALVGKGPALGFGPILSRSVPERVAIVVATSGTTGAKKEVGLAGSALLASASASNKYLGAHFGQVWSLLLPLTHIAGVNVLIRSLQLGTMPIDVRNSSDFPRADFTAIVPTHLFRALNGDEKLLKHLSECKAVLVGGGALSIPLANQAKENGINVVTTYGMTETSGGCVYDGTPLEGVEITTENGIIKIKGPVLATTYIGDEETWKDSVVNGWFVTKDLGEITSGKLSVISRADDVIISGGEKMSLVSIEDALNNNFPHSQFVAFTVKDPEWGDALHIAVMSNDDIEDQEIISFMSHTLGDVAKPKGIIHVDAFPHTELGKVDRTQLQSLVLRTKVK